MTFLDLPKPLGFWGVVSLNSDKLVDLWKTFCGESNRNKLDWIWSESQLLRICCVNSFCQSTVTNYNFQEVSRGGQPWSFSDRFGEFYFLIPQYTDIQETFETVRGPLYFTIHTFTCLYKYMGPNTFVSPPNSIRFRFRFRLLHSFGLSGLIGTFHFCYNLLSVKD